MLAKLPAERDALLRAADLIEERGLAKYTREDKTGGLCIHGAIAVAITGESDSDNENLLFPAEILAGRYLASIGYKRPHYAPEHHSASWNNSPERTKDEVVSALRSAALFGL